MPSGNASFLEAELSVPIRLVPPLDHYRISDQPSGIMNETNWDYARCPLSGVSLQ
jgi:hypothetical protein